MNWESVLRLMKNPVFREFADLAIQNRDVVSDLARKWGTKKQRSEAESAAGFDPEAAAREGARPPEPAVTTEELCGRLAALEAELAEANTATQAIRSELESRVRELQASAESLAQRLNSLESRSSSLENALQQAVSRLTTVEADGVRRTRLLGIGAAIVATWSVAAALLVHYLLR